MYKKIRKPLLIATICALIAFLLLSIWAALADQILLSKIASIIESITLFALILQVVLLAEQNRLALDSLKVDDSRKSKEKAIEMASFFRNEVLNYTGAITTTYEKIGVKKLLEREDAVLLSRFDLSELIDVYGDNIVAEYDECMNKISMDIIAPFIIFSPEIGKAFGDPVDKDPKVLDMQAKLFVSRLVTDSLNKLECFCMFFNYKIADEEVIYQSVHQVFLNTIKSLYINIAKINKTSSDKYYTNIIELFNKWEARDRETKALEKTLEKETLEKKNALSYKGKERNIDC